MNQHRTLIAPLACLLMAGLATAQTEEKPQSPSPAEQVAAVEQDYKEALAVFSKAFKTCKTDAERTKVFQERYPKADDYARRMWEVAEAHPDDPAAFDAQVWIVRNDRGGTYQTRAIKTLTERHIESERLAEICQSLRYVRSPAIGTALRKMRAESPHRDVRGVATLTLGLQLIETRQMKTAEPLLEEVIRDYADVKFGKRNAADVAKGSLYAQRKLGIGKTAPEVEGTDVDGNPLKLSQFRGNVVVFYFWGDW